MTHHSLHTTVSVGEGAHCVFRLCIIEEEGGGRHRVQIDRLAAVRQEYQWHTNTARGEFANRLESMSTWQSLESRPCMSYRSSCTSCSLGQTAQHTRSIRG